jgi:hypothetical protein
MKKFNSFGAFANHLRHLATEMPVVTAFIAELIGQHVEKRAKDSIGHYQTAAGEYSAWAPLKPATEARKAVMGYPANAPLLASGAMRDSISHVVARRMLGATVTVGSPDQLLVYHEFGTRKMPPRPVLGPAMFRSKAEIELIGAATLFAFLAGRTWRLKQ